jgi:hypothetical protein
MQKYENLMKGEGRKFILISRKKERSSEGPAL